MPRSTTDSNYYRSTLRFWKIHGFTVLMYPLEVGGGDGYVWKASRVKKYFPLCWGACFGVPVIVLFVSLCHSSHPSQAWEREHWTELVRLLNFLDLRNVDLIQRKLSCAAFSHSLHLKLCTDYRQLWPNRGACVCVYDLIFEKPLTRHLDFGCLSATTYLGDFRLFSYVFWLSVSSSVKLAREISNVPSFSELTGKCWVSCLHPVFLSHGNLC